MESSSQLNLRKPSFTSVLKKGVFEILEELSYKVIGCDVANMPAEADPKFAYESQTFDVLDVICMSLHVHFMFIFFWDEVRSKKI